MSVPTMMMLIVGVVIIHAECKASLGATSWVDLSLSYGFVAATSAKVEGKNI
jgi:hypothetical protein